MATQNLTSIGRICVALQQSHRAVESGLRDLGIAPIVRLNNIPHFEDEQIELLRKHLANQKREHPTNG